MDLVEFLLARIAEDEVVAQAALPDDGVWYSAGETGLDTDAEELLFLRHDPARVIAECEAKRRIVEWGEPNGPDYVLYLLALPYADHDDYRDEWRP